MPTLTLSETITQSISKRLAEVLELQPPPAPIFFVSPFEVVAIHYRLVKDFGGAPDPIRPAGVRDPHLLASAASRQWTGKEGRLFYPTPIENAATLLFGLCHNHCFHNGNKRTAFVTTLVHLDRNGFVLRGVPDNDIYHFLTSLAAHELKGKGGTRVPREDELEYVIKWLRTNVSKMRRGDRPLTFRQLRQILARYKYELRNPHKNFIDIYATADEMRHTFFGLTFTTRTKEHRVWTLSYPGENAELSRSTMKKIREKCDLTKENGIDSAAFYDQESIVDYWVNQYRKVLERLAKT